MSDKDIDIEQLEEEQLRQKESQRMAKIKYVYARQLNVYTFIPCHKKLLRSGEHHGFIIADPITKNIVLHLPGGREDKEIILDPNVICNGRFVDHKGKKYFKLQNALVFEGKKCDIYLRECNDMGKKYNEIPCDPSLSLNDIRLYLLTLLADLDKVPSDCTITPEEKRLLEELGRTIKVLGIPTPPKTGGKKRRTRKHKRGKKHKKTQKGGKRGKRTQKGRGKRRATRKSHKKKH